MNFVTGGSGLIGGALVDALRARGEEVVALARSQDAARVLAARGARVVRGHALDESALERGLRGCAVAYGVAGINSLCPEDPAELLRVNVEGASALVRAAARGGVARVVHTSSAAALGEAAGTVGREDSPHRGHYLSPYERSKREGEQAALAAGREEGVDVVCVNPASVQGPGRAGGTGRFLLLALNGRLPVFVDSRISLVDIDDCVAGHLLAAGRGRPGERYVLSGATVTATEALALIADLTGTPERPRFLGPRVARALGVAAEGGFRLARRHPPVCRAMVRTLLHGHAYDGSRATRELGLAYTPIAETLRKTAVWARDAGRLRRPLPGLAAKA